MQINYTRYPNRKYYRSGYGYSTLPEILQQHRNGNQVKIICARTKRDLTEDVLFWATFEAVPKYRYAEFIQFGKENP